MYHSDGPVDQVRYGWTYQTAMIRTSHDAEYDHRSFFVEILTILITFGMLTSPCHASKQ